MARIKIVKNGLTLIDVPVEFLLWSLAFHGKTQLEPPYTLHTTIETHFPNGEVGGTVTESQEILPGEHTGERMGPCPACDSLDGCQFSA